MRFHRVVLRDRAPDLMAHSDRSPMPVSSMSHEDDDESTAPPERAFSDPAADLVRSTDVAQREQIRRPRSAGLFDTRPPHWIETAARWFEFTEFDLAVDALARTTGISSGAPWIRWRIFPPPGWNPFPPPPWWAVAMMADPLNRTPRLALILRALIARMKRDMWRWKRFNQPARNPAVVTAMAVGPGRRGSGSSRDYAKVNVLIKMYEADIKAAERMLNSPNPPGAGDVQRLTRDVARTVRYEQGVGG